MTIAQYKIATEFSEFPIGRVPDDGDFNGELFRESVLLPLLQSNDEVVIDLDGTDGYGSSFLEEAFGGLTRLRGFTVSELRKKLHFIAEEDDSFVDEIWGYIEDGAKLSGQAN